MTWEPVRVEGLAHLKKLARKRMLGSAMHPNTSFGDRL